MRSLRIPFVAGMDRLSRGEILEAMEKAGARGYIDNANWPEQFPYRPVAVFDAVRSDNHIFISYFVKGFDLKAEFKDSNDPVWQDSCVEFFVMNPVEPHYYNFEFNCIGTCLASKKAGPDDREFISPEGIARIIRHTFMERETFSEKEGIFQWQLIVGIPFDLFGVNAANPPAGLRANFFKCGDGTSHPHYLSWSPIKYHKPNFHLPEFFGELIF